MYKFERPTVCPSCAPKGEIKFKSAYASCEVVYHQTLSPISRLFENNDHLLIESHLSLPPLPQTPPLVDLARLARPDFHALATNSALEFPDAYLVAPRADADSLAPCRDLRV